MDPTKPILDLYSTPSSYQPRPKQVKSPVSASRHQSKPASKEISYQQLKDKYQQLYQAYSEKIETLNYAEQQSLRIRQQNDRLRQQLRSVQQKNQSLNANLLSKNVELEQAYRQLQEDVRRGRGRGQRDGALERLEQGLREAVASNFELLREAAMSELRLH